MTGSAENVPETTEVLSEEGKYKIIGVDIDTTGRRLIDEIVHVAGYSPKSDYSQYVMPYMNLNPAARQRHQVRVITIGFFRMLKSMQTYKVMKTKPEYAALVDFLQWLESQKATIPNCKGVILLYYEQRNFVPYMLLEAVKKYDMLERFKNVVTGFANMFSMAKMEYGKSLKYFTLREMAKVSLSSQDDYKNAFEGSAKIRSRLTYEITHYLANKPPKTEAESDANVEAPEADGASAAAVQSDPKPESESKAEEVPRTEQQKDAVFYEVIVALSTSVEENLKELDGQQTILDRQNSLRSVFINYFKTTLYHRVKGVTYRRVLAEQGFDMDTLQDIWTREKFEGIKQAVDSLEELKDEEKSELIQLLDCHFDPEKAPVKPIVRKNNNNKRRFQGRRQPQRSSPRKRGPQKNTQQRNRGSPQKKMQQAAPGDCADNVPKVEIHEVPVAPEICAS
ncbi:Maternal protein exuperantia [Sergentomyia squamirostris]